MRTIRDVMHGEVEVLHTSETVADAACFLARHDAEAAPLCQSDGSLAGTVSNRDIVTRVVAEGRDPRQVSLAEFAGPPTMPWRSTSTSPLRTRLRSCAGISSPGSPCWKRPASSGSSRNAMSRARISFQPPWADT